MSEKRKNEWVEEVQVAGRDAVSKVRELIQQGNVRRLIVRKANGEQLMEFPLTPSVVVGGAMLVLAPAFAMLGGLVAYLAEVRIEIVRDTPPVDDDAEAVVPPSSTTTTKTRIDVD